MIVFGALLQLFAIAPENCQKLFLGLKPWYYYLDSSPPDSRFEGCDVKHFVFLPKSATNGGDVPLILLAIVDDLLRIAALVAIGFVLYGSIQMIASQGDPESTGRAQTTIINALVGLAIAIVATGFVAFLGSRLGN